MVQHTDIHWELYVKYAKIVLFSKSLYVLFYRWWFTALLDCRTHSSIHVVSLCLLTFLKYNDHQTRTCFVFFLRCVLHFDRYSSWNHDLNEIEQERMRRMSTEGGGQGHPPIKPTSNTTEGVQEYMNAVLRHPWSSSCAVL